MKVPIKYKIPLVGEYNEEISRCPECRENLLMLDEYQNIANFSIGIADSPIGEVMVIECPTCFTKWYFHTRNSDDDSGFVSTFLINIHFGRNKHIKKDENKKKSI